MTYSRTPMKSHFYKVELELRGLFRLGVSESILHLLFLLHCSCCFEGFESKERKERLATEMLAAQFGRMLSHSLSSYRLPEEPWACFFISLQLSFLIRVKVSFSLFFSGWCWGSSWGLGTAVMIKLCCMCTSPPPLHQKHHRPCVWQWSSMQWRKQKSMPVLITVSFSVCRRIRSEIAPCGRLPQGLRRE